MPFAEAVSRTLYEVADFLEDPTGLTGRMVMFDCIDTANRYNVSFSKTMRWHLRGAFYCCSMQKGSCE